MLFRSAIVQDPVPITRASFQAASNFEALSSDERRRRRAANRRRWLPPGFMAPLWVVKEDFFYDVGGPDSGERLVVPEGFEFDGATVPVPLTLFVPQTHSLYLGAAALHDWLYDSAPPHVSRERADHIFRDAMLVLGLNWFWAGLMWRAVRAGGWAYWAGYGPETVAGRILALPALLRLPLIWIVTLGRGLLGALFIDTWKCGEYMREAETISAADAPEAARRDRG